MPPLAQRLDDGDLPLLVQRLGLPGIFDTHVHFMPERMQAAVWAHFDRLDPPWPIAYRLPESDRLEVLRRLGITRHTALAYAHRPGMAAWLNDHTLALGARHDAVIPSFTLYPEPEAGQYVRAAVDAGGACVKVHLQVSKFDPSDPLLVEAWTLIERHGIPVVIHAGAVADGSGGEEWCGIRPVGRLLERHPGLRLVVAHLGVPDTADFLELAASHPDLRFDTAMALLEPLRFHPQPGWLPERLAEFGDRIFFGSDFPHIPDPVSDQVDALVRLGLGDEWLRGVLWYNAARFFTAGIPTGGG